MATTLSQQELKRLAVLGAEARLSALRAEMDSIVRAFPELGQAGRGRGRRGAGNAAASAEGAANSKGRRPYNMSESQRKAVSERMKKYWAARRKAKTGKRG